MKNKFPFYMFLFLSIPILNAQENYKDLMAQDWPNLKKYRMENAEIIKEKEYPTAVFMGNSITEGWKNTDPGFFKNNDFVNRGIGGQTTPQMLIRFMSDVVDLHPKVVVILAGTNDIAGNTGFSTVKMITNNIKAMAQLAETNNIEVVLSSILPVYDYPWRPGLEPIPKIAEINEWLKNYAQENNHTYLDYYSKMVDDKKGLMTKYSGDGVHPNKKGYEVMEPLVLQAIEKALE